MNNLFRLSIFFSVSLTFLGCQTEPTASQEKATAETFSLTIKNPTGQNWKGETFEVSTDFITKGKSDVEWSKIRFSDGDKIPFQLIDNDENGTPEKVLLLADVNAKGEKKIDVAFLDEKPNNIFTKRTYAEISHKVNGEWKERKYIGGEFKNVKKLNVPPEHTDHSEFIRYEGPGWESDKVGYRFYLDWRNAVDIFGKKTSEMVLHKVGLDGFASYHEPSDWGMDVLKVGSSLGIGSIGFWENGKAIRVEKTDSLHCEILQNGILQSKIRTQYLGWQINDQKLDLTSDLSIQAGSRMTRQDIAMTASIPNICTGIVKHDNGELIKKVPTDKGGQWGYIATYGNQSLADDNLGMVIFFKVEDLVEIQQDENSHVVVLKPNQNQLTYYFAAAWEQEPQGIKTMNEFKEYLEYQTLRFNIGSGVIY